MRRLHSCNLWSGDVQHLPESCMYCTHLPRLQMCAAQGDSQFAPLLCPSRCQAPILSNTSGHHCPRCRTFSATVCQSLVASRWWTDRTSVLIAPSSSRPVSDHTHTKQDELIPKKKVCTNGNEGTKMVSCSCAHIFPHAFRLDSCCNIPERSVPV